MKVKKNESGNIIITDSNDNLLHLLPKNFYIHKHPRKEGMYLISDKSRSENEREGIMVDEFVIQEIEKINNKVDTINCKDFTTKKYTKLKITVKNFTGSYYLFSEYFKEDFYYTVYNDKYTIFPRSLVKNANSFEIKDFVGTLDKVYILLELEDLGVNSYSFDRFHSNIEHIDFMDTRIYRVSFNKSSLTSFACNSVNAIESLILWDNNVKDVSLSQCMELRSLEIKEVGVTSLDFSVLKKLKFLRLYCANLKTIDLSPLINLDTLYFSGDLGSFAFRELDISMLSNLNSCYLSGLKDFTIYVTEKQREDLFTNMYNNINYKYNENLKIVVK